MKKIFCLTLILSGFLDTAFANANIDANKTNVALLDCKPGGNYQGYSQLWRIEALINKNGRVTTYKGTLEECQNFIRGLVVGQSSQEENQKLQLAELSDADRRYEEKVRSLFSSFGGYQSYTQQEL